ncbi:hypothetical protein FRX31_034796 [Thalictrum thalictroides]|uniref:Myb-like domain-containing protein n=1 Tax=Thalictrum thalictroides TaxID=46969 RepID=A0A7J6USZ9_THATH|nr:hypothetical protein FRX31_034796 [Thalictrum thalictroides]
MFMEETSIVKQILIMQIKQNKRKEVADAFAELCYIDAQNFEVTGLIPIELPQELENNVESDGITIFVLTSRSVEEDKAFIEAHKKHGNQWVEIARHIPGRSENAIEKRWNTYHRRK